MPLVWDAIENFLCSRFLIQCAALIMCIDSGSSIHPLIVYLPFVIVHSQPSCLIACVRVHVDRPMDGYYAHSYLLWYAVIPEFFGNNI